MQSFECETINHDSNAIFCGCGPTYVCKCMDTGPKVSELTESIACIDTLVVSLLPIHARVLLLLSLTYGMNRSELESICSGYTSLSFGQYILRPLVKDRRIIGGRRSYGYIYSCTEKGRRFVGSEISRIQLESSALVDRVSSCSNVRKDMAVVLAGYFPAISGK